MNYPETKKSADAEVLHGHRVTDPYRWLEEQSDAVCNWDEAQNCLTDQYLRSWEDYQAMEILIRELLDAGDSADEENSGYGLQLPQFRAGLVFQLRSRVGKRQAALFMREADSKDWTLLADPDRIIRGSFLDWYYPSPDGSYVAFGLSGGGDEQSVLHIIETASQRLLPELILFTSFCRLAWQPDSSGFFHSAGIASDFVNAEKYLFFHRLGQPTSSREPIRFNDIYISPLISPDGRYLVANVNWEMPRAAWYKDLHGDNTWKPFLSVLEGESFGEFYHDRFLVLTTDGAPRGRIVSVPIENASDRGSWQEIVGESQSVLQYFKVVGDYLIASELYGASSRLKVVSLSKGKEKIINLPGPGLIQSIGANDCSPFSVNGCKVYFVYETFTEPARLYSYDLAADRLEPVSPPPELDLSHIKVSQRYYPARDGVKIPLYLLHRKDLDLSEPAELLLYGYGGWNFIVSPCYVARPRNFVLPFIESGGICAYPGIRGGCEFGRKWWFGGRRRKKQTTFDDFYAAAEYLIRKGYTKPTKLAIAGASNGGLLIAVALTQRPDLFAAAVAEVPLTDLIRAVRDPYMQSYTDEYGDPADPEMLPVLLNYSPVHNVRPNTSYPAALFLSGYSDIRCQVWNSRKMAALLQNNTTADQPVLFRSVSGGHGPGLSIDQLVERKKIILSFIMHTLGMRLKVRRQGWYHRKEKGRSDE